MDNFTKLIEFLNELEAAKLYYRLSKKREGILVKIDVPGEKWEVEFSEGGAVKIEKFISTGEICDESAIKDLLKRFSSYETEYVFDRENAGSIQAPINFLDELYERKIAYELDKIRDSILIEVSVQGERWEIEFMENGFVDTEKFLGTGDIFDEAEIKNLFSNFSD